MPTASPFAAAAVMLPYLPPSVLSHRMTQNAVVGAADGPAPKRAGPEEAGVGAVEAARVDAPTASSGTLTPAATAATQTEPRTRRSGFRGLVITFPRLL
jgi:hypothetical protein